MTGVLLLLAAILLALAVHESAHALAFRRAGVPIVEAGLGVPVRPQLTVTTRSGFRWTLSPWLVLAYVQPDEDAQAAAERRWTYRQYAWPTNAGITANLLAGFLIEVVRAVLIPDAVVAGVTAGVWLAFAAVVWFGRRVLAAYVLPVFGVLFLFVIAWVLVSSALAGDPAVGMGPLVSDADTAAGGGLPTALHLFAGVQLALGLGNTLPLMPMDNGRVIGEWMRRHPGVFSRRVREVYERAGLAFLATLLLVGLVADVVRAALALL